MLAKLASSTEPRDIEVGVPSRPLLRGNKKKWSKRNLASNGKGESGSWLVIELMEQSVTTGVPVSILNKQPAFGCTLPQIQKSHY